MKPSATKSSRLIRLGRFRKAESSSKKSKDWRKVAKERIVLPLRPSASSVLGKPFCPGNFSNEISGG
jgi:hypothetical protein